MEYRDYYNVLGVTRTAAAEDIKKSYRRLARKYHPDVSKEKDAEQKFKEVQEAYEVLKDPEKRAAYDQLGSEWKSGEQFRPPPDWASGFEFSGGNRARGGGRAHAFEEEGFSDFFSSLFGGASPFAASPRQRQQAGRDHHARVDIDLEEAFGGGKSPSTPAPSGAAPGADGASPAPKDATAPGSSEQDDATKALEKAMGDQKPDGGK